MHNSSLDCQMGGIYFCYMSKIEKLLWQVLRGTSDSNLSFVALCQLLRHFGFHERIKGSHHIFTREDVEEIINIQSQGSQAKAYQVKQVRGIILKYRIGELPNE